jgi:hypothetical protein
LSAMRSWLSFFDAARSQDGTPWSIWATPSATNSATALQMEL